MRRQNSQSPLACRANKALGEIKKTHRTIESSYGELRHATYLREYPGNTLPALDPHERACRRRQAFEDRIVAEEKALEARILAFNAEFCPAKDKQEPLGFVMRTTRNGRATLSKVARIPEENGPGKCLLHYRKVRDGNNSDEEKQVTVHDISFY